MSFFGLHTRDEVRKLEEKARRDAIEDCRLLVKMNPPENIDMDLLCLKWMV